MDPVVTMAKTIITAYLTAPGPVLRTPHGQTRADVEITDALMWGLSDLRLAMPQVEEVLTWLGGRVTRKPNEPKTDTTQRLYEIRLLVQRKRDERTTEGE